MSVQNFPMYSFRHSDYHGNKAANAEQATADSIRIADSIAAVEAAAAEAAAAAAAADTVAVDLSLIHI